MQLVRGAHNIQPNHPGCVLTIGNFDGVHLGHCRVVQALVAKAKQLNCVSAVMVFEPQPQELFSPATAPARLSRLRDKYIQLKKLGVDTLICINFNGKFAGYSAEYFIEQLLVKKLAVQHLIIGDDFRFGHKRQGDFTLLRAAGAKFGFSVTDTSTYKLAECRISSTEIRKALERDDLVAAQQMLGRPYSIVGRVFHGDKQGRTLGFPTANLLLKRRVTPVAGVFVVHVNTERTSYYGVANIGSRPTVNGTKQQLEVHIFEFSGDLYGQTIEVVLLQKLRAERKFASMEELTAQISQDSRQALHVVAQLSTATKL
jgi:riboflavin kinase / FMN adenylyltransferase